MRRIPTEADFLMAYSVVPGQDLKYAIITVNAFIPSFPLQSTCDAIEKYMFYCHFFVYTFSVKLVLNQTMNKCFSPNGVRPYCLVLSIKIIDIQVLVDTFFEGVYFYLLGNPYRLLRLNEMPYE